MKPDTLIDGAGDSTVSTSQQSAGIAEALAMGITEALIKAFPELQPIFEEFARGNIAKARMDYFNSNYYKNLTGNAQSRRGKKAAQPGVYAQEFDAWKQGQIVRLAGKGIRMTPDIEAMLEDSYLAGDTDLQLDIKILDSGKYGAIGGSTLGLVNQLKNEAYEQGVNNILGADYWKKVSEGLFAGTMTQADVEEYIKNTAISAYPAYAKGIEAGRSFNLQTSAARQSIANILEKDVDTITNDNPLFQKVTGYVNPKTGAFEIMPLWQVEKLTKSSDEWLYTKNALATFDSFGRNILKSWGLAF